MSTSSTLIGCPLATVFIRAKVGDDFFEPPLARLVEVEEFDREERLKGEFLAKVRRVGVAGLRPTFFLMESGSIVEVEDDRAATMECDGRGVMSRSVSRLDLEDLWRSPLCILEGPGRELESVNSTESTSDESPSDDMDVTEAERGGGIGDGVRGPFGLFIDWRDSGR